MSAHRAGDVDGVIVLAAGEGGDTAGETAGDGEEVVAGSAVELAVAEIKFLVVADDDIRAFVAVERGVPAVVEDGVIAVAAAHGGTVRRIDDDVVAAFAVERDIAVNQTGSAFLVPLNELGTLDGIVTVGAADDGVDRRVDNGIAGH